MVFGNYLSLLLCQALGTGSRGFVGDWDFVNVGGMNDEWDIGIAQQFLAAGRRGG